MLESQMKPNYCLHSFIHRLQYFVLKYQKYLPMGILGISISFEGCTRYETMGTSFSLFSLVLPISKFIIRESSHLIT